MPLAKSTTNMPLSLSSIFDYLNSHRQPLTQINDDDTILWLLIPKQADTSQNLLKLLIKSNFATFTYETDWNPLTKRLARQYLIEAYEDYFDAVPLIQTKRPIHAYHNTVKLNLNNKNIFDYDYNAIETVLTEHQYLAELATIRTNGHARAKRNAMKDMASGLMPLTKAFLTKPESDYPNYAPISMTDFIGTYILIQQIGAHIDFVN